MVIIFGSCNLNHLYLFVATFKTHHHLILDNFHRLKKWSERLQKLKKLKDQNRSI